MSEFDYIINRSRETVGPHRNGGWVMRHELNVEDPNATGKPEGRLVALFNTGRLLFNIIDISVERRDKESGRELLSAALDEAKTIGAVVVLCVITEREHLEAVAEVFGEEHVAVYDEGDYGQENTDAVLRYRVPTSQIG